MVKRTLIFIAAVLVVPYLSFAAYGQLPSVYEVKKMPFNSDLFSDISPLIVKEGILFCSDKRFSVIKDRTAFDGHRLYNLYLAAGKDSTGWSAPAEIKSERNFLFNVGPSALAADGQTIYFTSEIETGKAAKKRKFKNHSGIFIARLSGRTIVSLQPFKYNNPEYNIGQPSVSSDGKYLFFASDMPGGQGGSDIYYCESVNGEWSGPKNLGPGVNTAGAENYPSIQSEGRLYFTSDRTGGYGKLDIYFTSMSDRKWDDPILLPEPINSTYDDFALKADDNLQKGYFTSNRDKSDDIYRFESAIIRKTTCPALLENSYCYRFSEENSAKLDTIPFRYDWRFGDGKEASGVIVEHCYLAVVA